jgi:hypothetical protein
MNTHAIIQNAKEIAWRFVVILVAAYGLGELGMYFFGPIGG